MLELVTSGSPSRSRWIAHRSNGGFAVRGGRGGYRRAIALVDHADLDSRFLGCLAKNLDVDVAAALLELDQRRVDGLIEGSAAAFSSFHVRSTPRFVVGLFAFARGCGRRSLLGRGWETLAAPRRRLLAIRCPLGGCRRCSSHTSPEP